jgi:hypothetical protein
MNYLNITQWSLIHLHYYKFNIIEDSSVTVKNIRDYKKEVNL